MIYTVTLNPSLDYIVHTDCLALGALNRTHDEQLYPGGKGINVSLMLARLGLPTCALGFAAGPTGQMFSELLAETGIASDFIALDCGMTRINVKIKSAAESELNAAGPEVSAEALRALEQKLGGLCTGDTLVLSGSVPQGVPCDIYARLAHRAAQAGAFAVVDAAGQALADALTEHPFLIKPNLDELRGLTGCTPHSLDHLVESVRGLQQQGAQNVLVSLAGEGAVLVPCEGKALTIPAPHGRVRNSVGAGDCMVAGFLSGLYQTREFPTALQAAVAAGSASAFSDWLPTEEEVCAQLVRTILPATLHA